MNSLYIALNVLKRTIGQRRNLLVFLLLPTLIISLIVGLIGKGSSSHEVLIHYVNSDRGTLSKFLIQELADKPNYKLSEMKDIQAMKEKVISQNASTAFVIPESFSEQLLSGNPPKVSMFQLNLTETTFTLNLNLDQAVSRMEQSVQSTQAAGISGNELLPKLELLFAEQQKHRVKAQITDYKLYANPAVQLTTGLLILFMMGLINSSVAVIMEDRKMRTMARIFTAPVRAIEIALGNFMGSFMIGFMQIATVLAVTRYIMGFDYGLPFFVHLTILLCFMLAALGISTTVAGLAKNSNLMGMINTMVITPTCMIGGCFWPIWIMPSFMQKLANFVPQKWAIEALENISSGQSLFQNRIEISVLVLFAIILLGFGSFILKPNEAESY